jgi:hypothetical protein
MKQRAFTAILGVGILLVIGSLSGCGEETQIAAAANGPPARPLQTGQTLCYDATGNTIPCAGTGQDGATQTGVARRYIDNGDGTITDASTGLMWEKKDQSGGIHDQSNDYNWSDAFTVFITNLNNAHFAGHTDWRLPNQLELYSLVDLGQTNPAINPVFDTNCTAGCTVTTCSCTQSTYYWSSTTSQINPPYAWGVYYYGGTSGYDGKSFNTSVRAVRGGL